MTTTTLTLPDLLLSQFPGAEWRVQSNAGSLTATARVSCFALRYRQDPKGLAFTILCGSVRVFHDEKSQTPEDCITASAKWFVSHIEQCQQAISGEQASCM